MTAKSFEDLVVWQKARRLTSSIYSVTKKEPFAHDFRLVEQTTSPSVSIMSNISEGFERHTRAEFHQAIVHAKGSAGEVRSQLYIALDAGYIDTVEFEDLSARV